jgi:hypothetical protein
MQQNSALSLPILVNLLKKWVKIGLASIKNPEANLGVSQNYVLAII